MENELEAVALASAGALSRKTDNGSAGGEAAACRNCGEVVNRKYCGACGQLAENFHKPVGDLLLEALTDLLSFDGRVARTIPALIFNPGQVTKRYLSGERQRFVPPFRLYLLASFVFFFALFTVSETSDWFRLNGGAPIEDVSGRQEGASPENKADPSIEPSKNPSEGSDTPATDAAESVPENSPGASAPDPQEEVERIIDDLQLSEDEVATLDSNIGKYFGPDGRIDRELLKHDIGLENRELQERQLIDSIVDSGADVFENRALLLVALNKWAPRLALAFLPLLVICLIIVFPFRKGIYVYDHLIVALHYQTWFYFLMTFTVIMIWLAQYWVWFVVFIAPLIYLYRMMRQVYGAGRFLAFLRTNIVLLILTIGFSIWAISVFAVSVQETSTLSHALAGNQ